MAGPDADVGALGQRRRGRYGGAVSGAAAAGRCPGGGALDDGLGRLRRAGRDAQDGSERDASRLRPGEHCRAAPAVRGETNPVGRVTNHCELMISVRRMRERPARPGAAMPPLGPLRVPTSPAGRRTKAGVSGSGYPRVRLGRPPSVPVGPSRQAERMYEPIALEVERAYGDGADRVGRKFAPGFAPMASP